MSVAVAQYDRMMLSATVIQAGAPERNVRIPILNPQLYLIDWYMGFQNLDINELPIGIDTISIDGNPSSQTSPMHASLDYQV